MEQKTNVHINWTMPPNAQFKERLNMAFAAGEPIDLVIVGGNGYVTTTRSEMLKYAEQGVVMPIQDYIESDTIHLKEGLKNKQGLREAFTTPDGEIYFTPAYAEVLHPTYYAKLWVNVTFLKNLGLKFPTNINEFREMLIAFRDKDANGNGNPNDEIPLAGAYDSWWTTRIDPYIMSAFVFDDGENRLYLENGKVVAAYAKPEFQAGLRYMNQLYREKLIYADSFTMSSSDRNQLNSQKYESIIGAATLGLPFIGNREEDEPVRWIDYECIPPLKGPDGLQITRYDYYGNDENNSAFVPSTARNPALVMRWLDYFYTDEGLTNKTFGSKGVTWEDALPGERGQGGTPATIRLIDLPRTDPRFGNMVWGNGLPGYMTDAWRLGYAQDQNMYDPEGKGAERFLYAKTKENYQPYGAPINMILPPLWYSPSDASTMAMLTTNINTYVEESIAKFITGQLNIDTDWNRFQTELKNLGIDQYLKIIQDTYNKSSFARK
jgi:putative aldouronate transport system substrate-binding protein